ncbi:protein FAM8A1 [Stomoxys calcitrans]|uniref:protein FAM8A1 n=1 Tax=Stomoxys calcitrans TaxID=35570 RepID=UPI0027E2A59B|nr:protein FAM8A1 [Stomoxys calcitrans]
MSDKQEIPGEVVKTEAATSSNDSTTATKTTSDESSKNKCREIGTREAYFASLNEWVKHANISQNAMAMFPWYLMSSYPQLFAQQQSQANNFMPVMGLNMPTTSNPALGGAAAGQVPNINAAMAGMGVGFNGFGGGFRIMNDQAQAEVINRTGGYEYVLAPFWKRAVAELIDMIIMLFLKIVTIFVVTNVFGFNLMLDMDKEVLNKAMENDDFASALIYSLDFLAFSSDLLAFEVATKLFVCLYEAVLTTFFDGASLGKHVVGLKIKYCEAMVPLPPNGQIPPPMGPQIQLGFQTPRIQMRALLFPAETPKFERAFMRAVAKNLILSLLFPMFFLMVFFKNNRTAYDIMTKTIVVESSSQPPLLRRP